jgi:hypothetical protein
MHNFICTACIVSVRLSATCITFALLVVEKQVGATMRTLSVYKMNHVAVFKLW